MLHCSEKTRRYPIAIEARSDGLSIRLMFRFSNRLDFNVLDLGFFAAIQALQYEYAPKHIGQLIEGSVGVFLEMPF